MSIELKDEYGTRAGAKTSEYPGGSYKDETVPGLLDGTPFQQDWANDFWGFLDAILKKANVAYSGSPDTADVSDRYDALLKLFSIFMSYEEPSGTPPTSGVYTIQTINGTVIDGYVNGMVINVFFRTRYDGVNPAKLKIGSLSSKNITETDGSLILENRLLADSVYTFRYNGAADRFEILTRPILPFQILFEYVTTVGTPGLTYSNTNAPKRWPITLATDPSISIPNASLSSELITLPKGFLYHVNIHASVDDSSGSGSRTRTYLAESSDPATAVLTDISDPGFTNHSAVIDGYLNYIGQSGTITLGVYTRSPNGGVIGQPVNNLYPEKCLYGRIVQIRN